MQSNNRAEFHLREIKSLEISSFVTLYDFLIPNVFLLECVQYRRRIWNAFFSCAVYSHMICAVLFAESVILQIMSEGNFFVPGATKLLISSKKHLMEWGWAQQLKKVCFEVITATPFYRAAGATSKHLALMAIKRDGATFNHLVALLRISALLTTKLFSCHTQNRLLRSL